MFENLDAIQRIIKRSLLFFMWLPMLFYAVFITMALPYIQNYMPTIIGLILYCIMFFLIKKNNRGGDIGAFIFSLLIILSSGPNFFSHSLFENRIDLFLIRICVVGALCLSIIDFINVTHNKKLINLQKKVLPRLTLNESFTSKVLTIVVVILTVLITGLVLWKYRNSNIVSEKQLIPVHTHLYNNQQTKLTLQIKNIILTPITSS